MLQKTRLICKGWCSWNLKTRICPIQCLETIWITLVVTVGIIWDPIECFEQMICSCVRFSVRPCCLKRFAFECMKKTHQHVEVIQVPFRPFRHYYIHKHIHRHHLQVGWIGGAWWPGGGNHLNSDDGGLSSKDEDVFDDTFLLICKTKRQRKPGWTHVYLSQKEKRLKCCFFSCVCVFFSSVRSISWNIWWCLDMLFSAFLPRDVIPRAFRASCFGFGGWYLTIAR